MRNCGWLLPWLLMLDPLLAQIPPPVDFNQAPFIKLSPEPNDVVAADFNEDGKVDLAVAAGLLPNSGGVIILLNRGDGTYDESSYIPLGDNTFRLVCADLNADRKVDLAATTGTNILILFGRGDGAFDLTDQYASGSSLHYSLAVGDVNGDDSPDLISAGAPVTVLLNDGKGRFSRGENIDLTAVSSVALADFNGDSRLDLVTAHSLSNFVTILIGKGDGTFRSTVRLGVEPFPPLNIPANTVLVTAADFNDDGKKDVVIAHSDLSLSFWLGQGDGTFLSGSRMRILDGYPIDIEASDLDGNGKIDLACATRGTVTVLLATANGAFTTSYYGAGRVLRGLTVVDMDADTRLDIAAADTVGGNLSLLFNKGAGLFAASEHYRAADGNSLDYLRSLAVVDLNRDGNLDMIGPNSTGAIVTRLGAGDGTFEKSNAYSLPGQTSWFSVADLNGDGYPDVVTPQARSFAVLFNLGDGRFGNAQTRALVAQPTTVKLADYNGDGQLDVIMLNVETNATLLLATGNGMFGPERKIDGVKGMGFLATADLNNDGRLDLVKDLDVFLGRGDGTFFLFSTNRLRFQTDVKTADLNHDGNLDVVAVNSRGKVAIYLGAGDGNLALLRTYSVDYTAEAAAIADFNGDTHPDIAVTGEGCAHILLGLGDGTFLRDGHFFADYPSQIVAGDVNQDGQVDLITSGSSVLLNQTSPSIEIERVRNSVKLSWPGFTAGFRLESTTDLLAGDSWRTVSGPVELVGGRSVITNAITEVNSFYRLNRQ